MTAKPDTSLIWRYIEQVNPSKEFLERLLASGKKLRIYHGIDPTGSKLHLGHSVSLLALRQLQRLGHQVILLVGDFTAQIGDPSGKTTERVPLSGAQVRQNMKTYKNQVAKLLEFGGKNPVTLQYNSRWLAKMNLGKFSELLKKFTVSKLLERDLFQRRIKEDKPITLNEFLYPLFQGYDSVVLDVDGEVGGSDQLFNMMVGRQLMRAYKNKEKFVLMVKLLEDPNTGKKMSKSEGTAIWLNEPAEQMFGHVMSLPDGIVRPCLELCTELEDTEIKNVIKLPARDAKLRLAYEIAKIYHGQQKAAAAKDAFERVFVKKQAPEKALVLALKSRGDLIIDLMLRAKVVPSKSEAKRLIEQGAVEINGKVVSDWRQKISSTATVKVGKHRFFKIVTK